MRDATHKAEYMDPVQLGVIGGGPKAAAIAAKAWALRKHDKADVQVTIFEPIQIGANWSGKSGYTNGEQQLCTIAERDVGYPYNSKAGPEVDVSMLSNFSWQRYLLTKPAGAGEFRAWVDAGRAPPLHKHFANYLQWVVRQSAPQAKVVRREVASLSVVAKKWQIDTIDAAGVLSPHPGLFDGVVVTGPGPAKTVPAIGGLPPASKTFNGIDFWRRIADVRRCLRTARAESKYSSDAIVIIGAGGTAAAILAWLLKNGAGNMLIQMVTTQASLYTRVDSVFENRLFSDDTQWAALSSESRRAFFERLNRGVVWETVIDQISSARKLEMVHGRAQFSSISSSGNVRLNVRGGDGASFDLNAAMLIDCSGFDAWWFLKMIQGLPSVLPKNEPARRERWQEKMAPSLQLQGFPWASRPPLHAPMLSSEIGPGYGSLMVLGDMANRILRPYL